MSDKVVKIGDHLKTQFDRQFLAALEMAGIMSMQLVIDPAIETNDTTSIIAVMLLERLKDLVDGMNFARSKGVVTLIDMELGENGYRLNGVEFRRREQ